MKETENFLLEFSSKTYHFLLEHQLTLVNIQCYISRNTRVLHVYTFPVTPFANLAEFQTCKYLRVHEWLFIVFFFTVDCCRF